VKFIVPVSNVAYSLPLALNRALPKKFSDPSGFGVLRGTNVTAGMPAGPISVAWPVEGLTVYTLFWKSVAHQDLLTLWQDADREIPVFKRAKAEYAKLQ
jgi:hypothetical protein